MADAFTIEFPRGDVAALQRELRRAQTVLHKSEKQIVIWGAINIGKSLAASTKLSAKLRPIVKNPDKGWMTDARKAPYGMKAYKRGKRVFRPLRGTGEYGKIRYQDKKSMRVKTWDQSTGEVRYVTFASGDIGAEKLGLMKDKRRIIGRRGLAAATWRRAVQAVGGSASFGNLSGSAVRIARSVMNVTKRLESFDKYIKLENGLRYAGSAFKTKGDQAVNSAFRRAADGMARKIDVAAGKTVFGK